jgi:putative SOS response-associated peptidase YedK
MCERYTQTRPLSEASAQIPFTPPELPFFPRYNVAPGQMAPVVIREEDRNVCKLMRWGLFAVGAERDSIGFSTIHLEMVNIHPIFRTAFAQRRCLVLADGFYLWKPESTGVRPYRYTLNDERPFAFAGLWAPAEESVHAFSIIVGEPNAMVAEADHRMAAIVHTGEYDFWLDPLTDVRSLKKILTPWPAELMKCYPVGDWVNQVGNEGPECIRPDPAPRLNTAGPGRGGVMRTQPRVAD